MKNIIYYFSGTGNTQAVVELLKKALEDKNDICELIKIEDITRGNRSFASHEDARIGLAYPIHAGDAPQIIYDFVSLMPMGNMDNIYILNSAADFIHPNDAAGKRIMKRLNKKGYHVYYERTIVMGSNFAMAYNERFVKQLYDIAKVKTAHMANDLLTGVERIRPAGIILKTFAALGHWFEDFGAHRFGKALKATDACTNCGKCYRDCPVCNISEDHGRIRFSNKCIWCMRCVYACPENAIKARLMGFTVIKRGYRLKDILKNDLLPASFVDKDTKGFYKHFFRYLQDPSI
jgi:ferredoxin